MATLPRSALHMPSFGRWYIGLTWRPAMQRWSSGVGAWQVIIGFVVIGHIGPWRLNA